MNPRSESISSARVALTRQSIVEAACQLVSDAGLRSLSLRRLAADLGVTAPALYAHVRDKSDLLASIAEIGFRELIDRYGEILTDDPVERIQQQGMIYVEMALANPGLFEVMFMFRPDALDVPGTDNELPAASEAFREPSSAIEAAIEVGAIHAAHDPFVTALSLWTVAHGLAVVMLMGVPPEPGQQTILQESVFGAMLRGLRLPPD